MASMKEIKRRRGSIQSTRQITKAMQLVSTVKLQKTRAKRVSLISVLCMRLCFLYCQKAAMSITDS